jgi:hypothetical protein
MALSDLWKKSAYLFQRGLFFTVHSIRHVFCLVKYLCYLINYFSSKIYFLIEEIPGEHLSFSVTGIKVNKLQRVALLCVPILRYHSGYQP